MRAIALILSLALLPQTEIRVDVRLQQIVVTVRDGDDKLVKNLHAEDFVLEEDGASQTIVHFAQDFETPVSIGLLVDTSGSMGDTPSGSLTALRAAVGTTRLLLHLMKPGDEFLLMSFSDGFDVRQGFTEDTARIELGLSKLRPQGGTDLIEGVEKGLRETRKGRHKKKALIVITDAYAEGDFKGLRSAIQNSEMLIYTFALQAIAPRISVSAAPFAAANTQLVLNALASESGSQSTVFEMHSDDLVNRMIAFVQDIAAELRGQYLIGYYPQKPGSSSSHAIRVRTKSPDYKARYQREALTIP